MLPHHNGTPRFEPAAINTALAAASVRARALRRSLKAPAADEDDFRQTLLLDLICRSDRFDAARGSWPAFACVVTRHAAARIAKRRSRASALITSLPPDHDLADDRYRTSAADLAIDLKRAVERLPPQLQSLVALIADTGDLACAQRASAVPTASFYRALGELRRRFIAEGIATGPRADLERNADRIGRSLA